MKRRTTIVLLCALAPPACGAELIIGRIDLSAQAADMTCTFPAVRAQGAERAPRIAAEALPCQVYINVNGTTHKLQTSDKSACSRTWDIPAKGQTFSHTYRDNALVLQATYRVTDVCWRGERCEYARMHGTFVLTSGQKSRTMQLAGICAY